MKLEDRPTPETLELRSHLEEQMGIGSYGWAVAFESMAEKCCDLERERDELQEQCNINAKQLLDTVNDRNSLGVQLDLLRDEFRRIEARIGESGLGDNPYLSHIADYCQRAQKDIAVRYTPIEERDRACERLSVVSLQLDDCKSQRDRLLGALEKAVAAHVFDAAWKPAARAAIAEVKGTK